MEPASRAQLSDCPTVRQSISGPETRRASASAKLTARARDRSTAGNAVPCTRASGRSREGRGRGGGKHTDRLLNRWLRDWPSSWDVRSHRLRKLERTRDEVEDCHCRLARPG